MSKRRKTGSYLNFWPAISDTFLAILIIVLMLGFVERLMFLQKVAHLEYDIDILKYDKTRCEGYRHTLENELQKCYNDKDGENIRCNNARLGWLKCKAEKEKYRNDLGKCEIEKEQYKCEKPPIIELPETIGFSFQTAKAELSEEFKNRLETKIVPKLRYIKNRYHVNVIEVIGHTDGAIAGGRSNLDQKLENAIATGDISGLRFGSNADLGLMRALAVALYLKKQLNGVNFRVYSAAQAILLDGTLANKPDRSENQNRRRIELRFTQL